MSVDFDYLRITLLPPALRASGALGGLFKAAFRPLKSLNAGFAAYEAEERRERSYGPTVRQLKAAIAHQMGIGESEVGIADTANREALALRRQSDGAATRLGLGSTALALWSDDQVWWNREFVVILPQSCAGREAEAKATVERWKMASSQYVITYEN